MGAGNPSFPPKAASLAHGLVVCDPGQDVTGVVSAQHHEDIMPVMAMNFRECWRGDSAGVNRSSCSSLWGRLPALDPASAPPS